MIDQQTTDIFMGRKDDRVPPRTGRSSPAVQIPLRSRDDNRGFTMIAVVVSMALLMVLLAIAAPLMSAYLKRSRGTICLSMRYVTEKAEMTYMIEKGRKATVPALVCPASGKPYVIGPGTDPEVHCPAPSVHGFRDIVVSRNKPVPELKK